TIQVWESSYRNDRWTRRKYRDGEWTEWQKNPNLSDIDERVSESTSGTKWVGYPDYGNQLLRTDDKGKLSISITSITEKQDVAIEGDVDCSIDGFDSVGAGEILRYRGFMSENEDMSKGS